MPPAQAPSGGGAAWRQLLLLLTVLPLTLAALAFVLQWRGGGVDDPTTRWPSHAFPGMAEPTPPSLPSSDCNDVLVGSSAPAFPYLRGWSFPSDSGAAIQTMASVEEHLQPTPLRGLSSSCPGSSITRSSASRSSCSSWRGRRSKESSSQFLWVAEFSVRLCS